MTVPPFFNEYFKEFKSNSSIFRDYRQLMPDYKPSNLINRKNQLSKILPPLKYALERGSIPPNFLLFGFSGTGKTLTMKYIINQLRQIYQDPPIFNKPLLSYFNCSLFNTPYRIIAEFGKILKISIKRAGISTEAAFDLLTQAINASHYRFFTIILDEMDLLFKRKVDANTFLYKLIRFPDLCEINAQFSIIGISNHLAIKNAFDSRVISSLKSQEIYFEPYSAIDLQEILYQRIGALNPEVLENGVIEFIAGFVAQNEGDARYALAILRTAGELAEQKELHSISLQSVKKAILKFSEIQRNEVVKSLPCQTKKILEAVQNIQHKSQHLTTGSLYNEYLRLCNQLQINPLGQRQFNNHLKNLENLHLISADPLYRGKYGNTRKITSYFS